ncbi:MAG: SPOR domain-containing protein [FCB group bacterium]|nr:SPOR domain-containing protein [FCB group bacterium]
MKKRISTRHTTKNAFFWIILSLSVMIWAQDSANPQVPVTIKSVPPKWPILINPVIEFPKAKTETSQNRDVERLVNGFRVQVLATRSSTRADDLKTTLIQKTSLPVYIFFESPNYKVRVGNYLITRKEADKAQKTIRALGYKTAWVVQSRIVVKEP